MKILFLFYFTLFYFILFYIILFYFISIFFRNVIHISNGKILKDGYKFIFSSKDYIYYYNY